MGPFRIRLQNLERHCQVAIQEQTHNQSKPELGAGWTLDSTYAKPATVLHFYAQVRELPFTSLWGKEVSLHGL
jgi:hypothetical protein